MGRIHYRNVGDFQPTKSRGQNFLVDPRYAERLVDALEPGPDDRVMEIGPGTGALTRQLLPRVREVTAIETDRRLAEYLRLELGEIPNFRLIEENFLELDPERLGEPPPTKCLGNLPYNITTPILLRLIDWPRPFERLVFTVQKEVAQRMAAKPGGKDYGRLSVLVALYGRPELVFDIPAGAFRPRPRVVSTVVRLRPRPDRPPGPHRGSRLEKVVAGAFAGRRKRMANSLSAQLSIDRARIEEILATLGIDVNARAEEVCPELYVRLAGLLPHED